MACGLPLRESDAKRTHLLGSKPGNPGFEKTNPIFSSERFRRRSSRDGVKTNPFRGSVTDVVEVAQVFGWQRTIGRPGTRQMSRCWQRTRSEDGMLRYLLQW